MRIASPSQMDQFLRGVEGRAFRMAQVATKSESDALDIVQEAMMKLVTSYSHKSIEEWRPLFYRILENKILDWHRKEQIMRKVFFWKKEKTEDQEDFQPLENNLSHSHDGEAELISDQLGEHLLKCIVALPLKQQQCFMLRSWEGLSVKETANAMNINENSVKTHYSRALAKLKDDYREITSEGEVR